MRHLAELATLFGPPESLCLSFPVPHGTWTSRVGTARIAVRPQPTKRPGDSAPLALSLFGDERARRAGHARAKPPPTSLHVCQKLRLEEREQAACSATAARWAPPSARDPPHARTHPLGSAALPASLTRGRWTSGPGRSPWVWPIASSRPKLSSTRCQGPWSPGQLRTPWRRERKMQ